MKENNGTEKLIDEFNEEVENFIEENSKKIACMIAYSVPHMYQPFLATYQQYFNQNVTNIYDSRSFYIGNKDLPDFLCVYFVLLKEGENVESKTVHEHCKVYINNFAEFNKGPLSGLSAYAYDIESLKIIDELHKGDKESLRAMKFLNN